MFRAIGFILVLITIRILMSDVFHALESTLVSFFEALSRFASVVDPNSFSAASFEAMAPQLPHY